MNLKDHFPNASQACRLLNAVATPIKPKENDVQPIVATRRGKMNKTESEFAMILEARKRKGEILHWEFEGITLRWNGISFTPDFTVIGGEILFSGEPPVIGDMTIRFIEVKGAFMGGNRARAVERFRHARTYWGKYFTFQLWQKTKDGWGTPRI